MNRTDLTELIHHGENSGVEFKRDDIPPEKLAKEMAALLNLEGGFILLGIEKDRRISGLSRPPEKAEEWVMEVARTHLRPAAIPFWETIILNVPRERNATELNGTPQLDERIVGVISLPADGPDKPYKCKRGSAWVSQIRVGTTSRDATDEEEVRLYVQSGRLQYDRKPIPGSVLEDLDMRRLVNYFQNIRKQSFPDSNDSEGWTRLLVNTELMYEDRSRPVPSAGGLVLFGIRPQKYMPQTGISAVAFSGVVKDYDARARSTLRGPIVSLFPSLSQDPGQPYPRLPRNFSEADGAMEPGVIEQAMDFVRRNIGITAWIDHGGRRQERWDYPLEAIREAIVNAIAHRDYSITVIDIELSIYSNRIEIISPGRLPNTVTVDKMRAGYRASRNELIKEVLRDYRYIEATGLGVPRKIVEGMRSHNGTEADLIEEESRFIVTLWKNAPSAELVQNPRGI